MIWDIVEIIGFVLLAAGAWLWVHPGAGLIVGGAGLLIIANGHGG